MKKNLIKIGIFALAITVLSSCKKDEVVDPCGDELTNGYFVTNEGNFGTGNGSISYVKYGEVRNNVFECRNELLLGDVVQSMTIIDDNAYIMVNGSSKIEVASVDFMYSVATIQGSVSPRYMAKVSDSKAYVTDWGVNGVQVIDLLTNKISSTIACGTGPEGITVANGFAYVCNVGGWGLDNTVSVINTTTDAVETTLTVGDKPNSVVVDVNGAVWVLSGGYTEWNEDYTEILSQTSGSLVKIINNIIELSIDFPIGNSPQNLLVNDAGTTLYYSDGSWSKAVYAFDVNDTALSTTALINRSFYGLGVHGGYVYGTDAVDFTQSGWSYKYTSEGTIIDSVQVGIIPGGYCFN